MVLNRLFIATHSDITIYHIISFLSKLYERFGTPLKDWNIRINYGIKTGCNEAFIISEEKRSKILASCKSEEERERTDKLIRPILRGRDIRRDAYEWPGLYVILSHNGYKNGSIRTPRIDIKDYPTVKNWLDNGNWNKKIATMSNAERLASRTDKGETYYNLRDCAYMDDFDKQKIMYSEIVREPQFLLDDEHFVPEATSFIMSGEHLSYLVAYLNSPLVGWIFKKYYAGGGLGENGYRYKKQFLINLPIPRPIASGKITEDDIIKSYNLTDDEIKFISSSVRA